MERKSDQELREMAYRLGMDPADLIGEEERRVGGPEASPEEEPYYPLGDCPACAGVDGTCSSCDERLWEYGLDARSIAAEEEKWQTIREEEAEHADYSY